MRSVAVGLCLVLLSAPASAADWVYVATDRDGAVHYYDPTSVRRVGNYLASWMKVDHSRDPTVSYNEAKDLWYYDCANDSAALKSWINYKTDGSVESSHTKSDYSLKWSPAAPETIGWSFQRLICGISECARRGGSRDAAQNRRGKYSEFSSRD